MPYSTLRSSITNKFPSLRILPKFNVFGTAWRELEKDERIHIEWTDRTHSVFFLNENFQQIETGIASIDKNQQNIHFTDYIY